MSAHRFRFTPVDTLFFRDGRPFEAEALQGEAESLFPPPTRTLMGACRLALARGQGYKGPAAWSGKLARVLGDGPDSVGELRFSGPHLSLGKEALIPFPMHVLGEQGADADGNVFFTPTTFLEPGEAVLCDLGQARLPVPKTKGVALQSGEGLYLRPAAFEAVLEGKLPGKDDVVLPERLYVRETRIGLERDAATRTAVQGKLFGATHLRLRDDVSFVVDVEGVPKGWAKDCPPLVGLGGESRMAELELADAAKKLKTPLGAIESGGRCTVTLLTPLQLTKATMFGPGAMFADWSGVRVESASLGKPIFLGGWDFKERKSLPLRPYLPPGSTWFCSVDANRMKDMQARHLSCLGSEGAFGFGAVALGIW